MTMMTSSKVRVLAGALTCFTAFFLSLQVLILWIRSAAGKNSKPPRRGDDDHVVGDDAAPGQAEHSV